MATTGVTGQHANTSERETNGIKNGLTENWTVITEGVDRIFSIVPPEIGWPGTEVVLNGTVFVLDFYNREIRVRATAVSNALDDRKQAGTVVKKAMAKGADVYRTHRNIVNLAGSDAWLAMFGLSEEPDGEQAKFIAQLELAEERYNQYLDQELTPTQPAGPELKLPKMLTEISAVKTALNTAVGAIAKSHKAVDASRKELTEFAKTARRIRRGAKWLIRGLLFFANLGHLVKSFEPLTQAKSKKAQEAALKAAKTRAERKLAAAQALVDEAGNKDGEPSEEKPSDAVQTEANDDDMPTGTPV